MTWNYCNNCNIRRGELTKHDKGLVCYNNGSWCLVSKYGNIFLRWKGKEYYLVELVEKEWNYVYKRGDTNGFRNYYELAKKMLMLKKLRQEIGMDAEESIKVVSRVRSLAVATFNNLIV